MYISNCECRIGLSSDKNCCIEEKFSSSKKEQSANLHIFKFIYCIVYCCLKENCVVPVTFLMCGVPFATHCNSILWQQRQMPNALNNIMKLIGNSIDFIIEIGTIDNNAFIVHMF